MTEYTYHNGVLRVKSDAPVAPEAELPVTREYPDRVETTLYRLGSRLKAETAGGYHYAWFAATPLTVTVDHTPLLNRRLEELQLAVAELAETLLGGEETW